MIYLDYDRLPGEWIPNSNGTNENLEAISFIKKLNTAVFSEFPDALMIAEESTAFGKITAPVSQGGLGFNMKWNMGFANDLYDYLESPPSSRSRKHSALNFPLMYAFSENYCLPISHDEVVHGKKSFVDKMNGVYEDKFLEARAALMLFMTYPGKKLLFMGCEYAPFREWDYESSLEWFMLDYPNHAYFRDYTASLNHFYLSHSELWEYDFSPCGFEWIYADEADKKTVAFKRFNRKGECLLIFISFSERSESLAIPLSHDGKLLWLFDTGNFNPVSKELYIYPKQQGYCADITLPPFSGVILTQKSKTTKSKSKENKNVL